MLGSRLPKNQRFTYEPRFYDPKKDEREKRRVDFRKSYRKKQAKQKSLIWLGALVILVLYALYILSKIWR
ncbi:hypothetical protein HQ585_03965 [candidate division KSB1 bacterium]|nr:hypothetical protein [candidate division KSB1 bacterium]